MKYGQEDAMPSNIDIPTPMKKETGCKRFGSKTLNMDIDIKHPSKKSRTESPPG